MTLACFCRRCVPTDAPVVCSACGQEVRFGIRDGVTGHLHREEVDHVTVLGHRVQMRLPGAQVEEAEGDEDDDLPVGELPPVEEPAHPVDPDDFPPRSGIRQVINLVEKTPGWERAALTSSRGPYMGAKGQCLSISEVVLLKARNVLLDGSIQVAVASWRDGKFDFAYIGTIKDHRLNPARVDATSMKNWIKGTYDPPDPVQQP